MSKYAGLWEHLQKQGTRSLWLTFAEIQKLTGTPMDHSFLNYKKELLNIGYQVKKISLKDNVVLFERLWS
ncbi:MAG: hypothetical protein LBR25_09810 [Erysipelotrichaceae bacterium]|jgi:hypothetical protein|nr:hypothetical protein [Erysipelotrichaceae bacterium]